MERRCVDRINDLNLDTVTLETRSAGFLRGALM